MSKDKKKRKIDLLFITACISTSLVLLLVGIITLFLLTANDLSRQLREEMTLELVLNSDFSDNDATILNKKISQKAYCKETHYISQSEALKEMSDYLGVNPSDFLKYNPFYASISVKLNADYACGDSIVDIKKELLQNKGVQEINFQQDLLEKVNSNIHKISLVLFLFAILLALISFALINNTIKLTIYSQRFVLYSMKLVGAKWSFIRRPFIVRNFWIGIVSAILAGAAIYFGLKFGIRYEPSLSIMMEPRIMYVVFLLITIVGILITYLCALSSVNRFLRMKSGELYYI